MIVVILLLDIIIPGIIPKWAIFAPIFIPLFVQLGVPPQTASRPTASRTRRSTRSRR